jgi:hypothetical protein
MIEADAHGESLSRQRQQLCFEAPHRAHGVGEDEHFKTARLRQCDHRRHLAVHERLAAGKADLTDRQPVAGDFIEILRQIGKAQIGQRIVGRRTLDIAGGAAKVAQRAGVEPQRFQRFQFDCRARLAFGGDVRIAELGRIEPRRGDGERRKAGDGGGSPVRLAGNDSAGSMTGLQALQAMAQRRRCR